MTDGFYLRCYNVATNSRTNESRIKTHAGGTLRRGGSADFWMRDLAQLLRQHLLRGAKHIIIRRPGVASQ